MSAALIITTLFEAGKLAIEKFYPDPEKRAKALFALEELKMKGDLAELQAYVSVVQGQLSVNANEAKHASIFIAGWRPFVGWVGGVGFAYAVIIEPMARFVANLCGYTGEFPLIDVGILQTTLFGMLGIGGMRSFDKYKGTDTKSVGKDK